MQNVLNKTLTLFVIIGFMALTLFLIIQNAQKAVGSVDYEFSGYQATTTDANWVGGTSAKVLKTGGGVMGSVVVTLGSGAGLELYDATTTNHVNTATTTIAVFNSTTPAGTYTFDVTFTKGLLVVTPTTVGVASTTITWK